MNKSTCLIGECERETVARGFCHKHYEYQRYKGLLKPKKCKGCGKHFEGRRWYCNEDCKPRCSVEGCDDQSRSRGWCTFHYTRWKLTGDPSAPLSKQQYMTGQLCSYEGCDGNARKVGLCASHYNQTREGRELSPLNKKNKKLGLTTCCLNGCDNPLYAHYLCGTHLMRLKRTGTTRLIPELSTVCRYPKCENPRRANGWCLKHWKRLFVSKTPALKTCTQCGTEMRMWEEDHNGRLRPRNRNLCGECIRPSSLTLYVPFLVQRDGTDCKLCGMTINMDLPFPDPLSRTVDHIVPFSLGGPNHVDNYQLAHYRCNMLKGNRLAPPDK